MAYDEHLADRLRLSMQRLSIRVEEKKMMGGLCMMVDEKMCVGIIKDSLMVRIDPAIYNSSLNKKGCKPMDFTGRILKGFVLVAPEGMDTDKQLDYWVGLALEFNPRAKSSKKKK